MENLYKVKSFIFGDFLGENWKDGRENVKITKTSRQVLQPHMWLCYTLRVMTLTDEQQTKFTRVLSLSLTGANEEYVSQVEFDKDMEAIDDLRTFLDSQKSIKKSKPTKTKRYREALEYIALHFNHCDLSGDRSSLVVMKRACQALGWTYSIDAANELVIEKEKV